MTKMTQSRINDLEIENADLRRLLKDQPTLRDQFAMAAMTGLLAYAWVRAYERDLAAEAYEYADAMMEARDAE